MTLPKGIIATPQVRPDNLAEVVRILKHNIDLLTGFGDPAGRVLTLGDVGGSSGGSVVIGGGSAPAGSGYDPYTDFTTPPPPTGLVVSGALKNFIVRVDPPPPTYKNQAYVEIWSNTSDTPTGRTLRGLTTSNFLVLPSSGGETLYFWARSVSLANVTGPFNGTPGTVGTTGPDVEYLLEQLEGQILAGQLHPTLATPIALIEAPASTAGSVNARIAAETSGRAAALAALSAVKSRTFHSGTAPVSDANYTLQTNDTWFQTSNGNKQYRWNGTAWEATDDTRIGQAVTDIGLETTNRINGDSAEIAVRESLYAGLGAAIGTDYKVFNQSSTPTGTTIGDVWTWKAGGTETFQRWNGTTWVNSLSDKRAAVYRGEFANNGALPTSGNVIGDLARRTDSNIVVVWDGSGWVAKSNPPAPVFAFVERESASRVAGDSAEAQARDTLAVQLRGSYTGNDATSPSLTSGLVHSERQARVTAVNAEAQRIDALQVSVNTPSTGLLARASALESVTTNITSGNGALSDRVTSVSGRTTSLESSVNTAGTGLLSRAAALESVTTNASSGNSALAERTSYLEASVNTGGTGLLARAAALESVTTNVTSGNTALSNRTGTLEAKVTAPSASPGANYNPTWASLQSTQSAFASLDGRASTTYTVRTTVSSGGRTVSGGFGLMGSSTAVPGSEIEFGVLANRFWVGAPSGSGFTDRQMFTIQTTNWDDNGVSRPPGAYIEAAFIKNLVAVYATIGNLVADDIAAAYINVAKLTAGSLDVGAYIQSGGFSPGSGSSYGIGFRISGNGNAEFNNATFRGTVYANAGILRGLTIQAADGSTLISAGASASTTTFSGNVTGSINGSSASTLVNKVAGIAEGATANQSDATTNGLIATAATTANWANVSSRPTSLSGINSTEASKLAGIQDNATANQSDATTNSLIATAATTAQWSNIAGQANAPASNATVGAPNGTYVGGQLAQDVSASVSAVYDPETGLTQRLRSNARNVLAGSGGLATGNLTWNSAGVRDGGYGVGITQNGIVAFNSGGVNTFMLDGASGNATFRGTLDVVGTGGDRMEITNTRIKIFSGGQERVRIGDLSG